MAIHREGVRPRKGTGDDPPHGVLPFPTLGQHGAGDLAHAVQLLHGHHLLVGGDLKHAVSRGIHYQRTGPYMLVGVVLNDLRARIRLVA